TKDKQAQELTTLRKKLIPTSLYFLIFLVFCMSLWCWSMVKHKLPRIHDRPEHIFQCFLLIRLGGHQAFQLGAFGRLRLAAQTADVKFFNDLPRRSFLVQAATDEIACLNFLCRGIAVEKMQ